MIEIDEDYFTIETSQNAHRTWKAGGGVKPDQMLC